MISSATAVPVANKDAVDNTINVSLESQQPESQLCNLYDIQANPSCWDGIRSMFMDLTIIDKCWEYYNDNTVRTKLVEVQTEIENEINKLPEQDRQLIREFLDIENTLSLASIADRVSSLRLGTVLYDVQDVLEVPDNYGEFSSSREGSTIKLLELMYNNDFENMDIYYPLIDRVCEILAGISLIWTVPLMILGGLTGLIIASFVTLVFFAPITVPMALYVGVSECFINDEDFRLELMEIALLYGLVGLLLKGTPLLLVKLFSDNWGMIGVEYILSKLTIWSVDEENGEYALITGADSPRLRGRGLYLTGKKLDISLHVSDTDYVATLYNPDDKLARDYIQIGIDWDGDYEVDEWSDLVKAKYNDEVTIDLTHRYADYGTYKITYWPRDNWGNTGTPWSEVITISRSRTIFGMPFFQNFPQLAMILEKLFSMTNHII